MVHDAETNDEQGISGASPLHPAAMFRTPANRDSQCAQNLGGDALSGIAHNVWSSNESGLLPAKPCLEGIAPVQDANHIRSIALPALLFSKR
jgi:hypothetical protein